MRPMQWTTTTERVAFTRYLPGKLDSLLGICISTLAGGTGGRASERARRVRWVLPFSDCGVWEETRWVGI